MPWIYVVRPRAELLERVPANAWFARAHVWSLPSVGDHDSAGQQRLAEARLKLMVLAEIHADSAGERAAGTEIMVELATRAREAARALTEWLPLTLETFDRLFDLEAVGVSYRVCDPEHIAETSLLAVLPSPESDLVAEKPWGRFSLRESWSQMMEIHRERHRAIIAGVRALLPKLFEVYADLAAPPDCAVNVGAGSLPRASLVDLLEKDGWRLDPHAPLLLSLRTADGPLTDGDTYVDLDFECRVRGPRGGARRRGSLRATSAVSARVRREGTEWRVVEASMKVEATRSLLP